MQAAKIALAIVFTIAGFNHLSAEEPVRTSVDPEVKIAQKAEAAETKPPEKPSKPRKPAKTVYLSGNPETVDYVRKEAAKRGWTGSQWDDLNHLIHNESSWDPNISNPYSTACGLFQDINCSYELGNVPQQTKWGLDYIARRYGDPSAAWYFWQFIAPTIDVHGNGTPIGENWY